ncbi:alpha/beta hydrolase fold domain-containing protein [Arcanobacterium hippocoleae]|uniref:Acetyl esterase/lipase n=1 Tax=Arcanobacterium hippocoleae TaxID=149017 RepID=A0ABU1T2Z7_9ACTO|nr:alpha/beta hydrolase fold domain-containing protein [Arcanobacterium hippocoleae]MDR6939757.1 acetyl esterase/lipase [Arcanobacterium hippocoleae]
MNQNLHYEVIGKPVRGTMICFPGNKKTRPHGLIKQIQDAFSAQWRVVICTDLGVETDETEYSLYDAATDFVTQIERETPGIGVVLLGINRGARIALKVAQRVPQIVNGAAVIGRLIEKPGVIKKLVKKMPTDLPQLWVPSLADGGTFEKVQEFLNLACPEFPAANPWIDPALAEMLKVNVPNLNPTVQEQRENGERLHPPFPMPQGFTVRNLTVNVANPQVPEALGEIPTRVIVRESIGANASDATDRVLDGSANTVPQAVLFLIHGGGYVAGAARFEDDRALDMMQDFHAFLGVEHPELHLTKFDNPEISVVIPDYRLAPEFPHPIGREDTLSSLRWVFAQYPEVPVLIYGDSAGSGMAYQVLSQLSHAELARIAGVIALEPCLDPQLATVSSFNYAWGPTWNRGVAAAAWDYYRQGNAPVYEIYPPIGGELDPAFPPVLVIVNPADTLRDEGTAWAYRLMDAGVKVQLVTIPGTYHGSLAGVGTKTWELVKRAMRPFVAECLAEFKFLG